MHDNYDLDQMMELVQERKFRALREILTEMNEVDIAGFLDGLEVEQELLVFRTPIGDVPQAEYYDFDGVLDMAGVYWG